MDKYYFRPYSNKFKLFFSREKRNLKRILPLSKIEHVGSTSVPNLGGKGIIDIVIAVNKNQVQKSKKKLIKNNYIFKSHAGDKTRIFFEKDYKYNKKIRRVHLHLTNNNSITWKNMISLRNYLKNNPKVCKEYTRIKKQAVKICNGKGKRYRQYKNKFLKKITKKSFISS